MLTCICPVLSVSSPVQNRRSNLAQGTQIMSQSPSQGLFGYPMGKTQISADDIYIAYSKTLKDKSQSCNSYLQKFRIKI